MRKQSLVGAERYTTERLSEIESEINSAGEKIIEIERRLFLEVCRRVKEEVSLLLELAVRVSELDALQSFAFAATVYGYTRPKISKKREIRIVDGRHPVVEAHLPPGSFIPNGVNLDSEVFFILLTGPNMAGKSTYLRQVALTVLMAQVGSFVPAQEATIGIVDKIFCRVGSTDNLARGESTFLVEMNETANILRNASARSLLILDEIGRGTGTKDGLAIARAVIEFILDRMGAQTLFATHFHELTTLRHPGLRNRTMEVLESDEEIVFLKRVKEGSSSNSYGIHVARLAGIPEAVLGQAEKILKGLPSEAFEQPSPVENSQRPLFTPDSLILEDIRNLNVDDTTPLQALMLLEKWKRELGGDDR
jgi:DNA mismatch repair protein MutS